MQGFVQLVAFGDTILRGEVLAEGGHRRKKVFGIHKTASQLGFLVRFLVGADYRVSGSGTQDLLLALAGGFRGNCPRLRGAVGLGKPF